LQWDEGLEHLLDIGIAGRPAMDFRPALAHRRDLGDALDMDPLMRAHRHARLVHRDRHLLAAEDLDEDDGRRHAAMVHGRAGPIQQYRLDRALVAALEAERGRYLVHGGAILSEREFHWRISPLLVFIQFGLSIDYIDLV